MDCICGSLNEDTVTGVCKLVWSMQVWVQVSGEFSVWENWPPQAWGDTAYAERGTLIVATQTP